MSPTNCSRAHWDCAVKTSVFTYSALPTSTSFCALIGAGSHRRNPACWLVEREHKYRACFPHLFSSLWAIHDGGFVFHQEIFLAFLKFTALENDSSFSTILIDLISILNSSINRLNEHEYIGIWIWVHCFYVKSQLQYFTSNISDNSWRKIVNPAYFNKKNYNDLWLVCYFF